MIDATISTAPIPNHIPSECVSLQKKIIVGAIIGANKSIFAKGLKQRLDSGATTQAELHGYSCDSVHLDSMSSLPQDNTIIENLMYRNGNLEVVEICQDTFLVLSVPICIIHTNKQGESSASSITSIYTSSMQNFMSSGSIADFNVPAHGTAYDSLKERQIQNTIESELSELTRDIIELLESFENNDYISLKVDRDTILSAYSVANLWPTNIPIPTLSVCDEGNLNLYSLDDDGFVIAGLEFSRGNCGTYIIYDDERKIADVGQLDAPSEDEIMDFFSKISEIRKG